MDVIWDLICSYGWQAVVIALFTFTLVECIKPLARKFIKKENVRHVVYIACSYVFAILLSLVLAAILGNVKDTFTLFAPAIVVINVLGQIISNAGFWNWLENAIAESWAKMTESGAWKKALKELSNLFGADTKVLDAVADKIEAEYDTLIKAGKNEFLEENKEEIVSNMKQKLAGFVDNTKLQEIAEGLFSKLVEAWTPKVKEETSTETTTEEATAEVVTETTETEEVSENKEV